MTGAHLAWSTAQERARSPLPDVLDQHGLGLVLMYVVMFSMIDGSGDFRTNLNTFRVADTMWAPMGVFMLATMPGMFPNRRMNMLLYTGLIL